MLSTLRHEVATLWQSTAGDYRRVRRPDGTGMNLSNTLLFLDSRFRGSDIDRLINMVLQQFYREL
ncbi:MAG TPA: hypothetical protein ENF16_04775 [Bacteroidetes bacterium]|nr:hypothetical protein [Bacteroidota bacterium]